MKNLLHSYPRQMAAAVKSGLDDIQHAGSRADAETALTVFSENSGFKYQKALACGAKDKVELFAFLDFPANHRGHLRTSNPVDIPRAFTRTDGVHALGCHSPAQNGSHQRRAVANNRKADGFHPCSGGIKEMAASQG